MTAAKLRHMVGGLTMQPEIVIRGAELAIGMGASFKPKSTSEIAQLWGRFVSRMHEIKNAKAGYTLGICSMEHPSVQKGDGDCFVYIAAVPVHKVEDIPEGMVLCELKPSQYARFTHKGQIMDIAHTVDYIWGTWATQSNRKLKKAPDFELYDERFDPRTGAGEVDIYVPIED